MSSSVGDAQVKTIPEPSETSQWTTLHFQWAMQTFSDNFDKHMFL